MPDLWLGPTNTTQGCMKFEILRVRKRKEEKSKEKKQPETKDNNNIYHQHHCNNNNNHNSSSNYKFWVYTIFILTDLNN